MRISDLTVFFSKTFLLILFIGFVQTTFADAFDDARAAYEKGDYATALQVFQSLAEQGDAKGQNALGLMYLEGLAVPQDYSEAIHWFRKSTQQGYAGAQANMGLMYLDGLGIERDYGEAAKWYRKAAEQGHVRAQANLGWMYHDGLGVEQDYKGALEWWRKAGEQGHARAQHSLGQMYRLGEGVNQDYKEAATWYRKAAEQGFSESQFNLGMQYLRGEGVIQDERIGFEWTKKSAEQKHTRAQTILGVLYLMGKGTERDLIQAYAWLSVAAMAGDNEALDTVVEMPPEIPAGKADQARSLSENYMNMYGPNLWTTEGWIQASRNLAQCEKLVRSKYPDVSVDDYSGLTWVCFEIFVPYTMGMLAYLDSYGGTSCYQNNALGTLNKIDQWVQENPEKLGLTLEELIPLFCDLNSS